MSPIGDIPPDRFDRPDREPLKPSGKLTVSGMGGAFLNRPWRPETQVNV
jgi:hypothetical protein